MQRGAVRAWQVLHGPGLGGERHRRPGPPPEGGHQQPAAARHQHQQEAAPQGGCLPGEIGAPAGHSLTEGQRRGRGACAVGVRLDHRGRTRQRVVPGGEEPDPTPEEPQGEQPPEPDPEYGKRHEGHGVCLSSLECGEPRRRQVPLACAEPARLVTQGRGTCTPLRVSLRDRAHGKGRETTAAIKAKASLALPRLHARMTPCGLAHFSMAFRAFFARAAPIAVLTSFSSSGGGRTAGKPKDAIQSSRDQPVV